MTAFLLRVKLTARNGSSGYIIAIMSSGPTCVSMNLTSGSFTARLAPSRTW